MFNIYKVSPYLDTLLAYMIDNIQNLFILLKLVTNII